MGYYTDYHLKIVHKELDEVNRENFLKIKDELLNIFAIYYNEENKYDEGIITVVNRLLTCKHNMKWYEHREDMRKLSKKFTDYVFILIGKGESGEFWINTFSDTDIQDKSDERYW